MSTDAEITVSITDITLTQRMVGGDVGRDEWTAEFYGPLSSGIWVKLIPCAAETFAEAYIMLLTSIAKNGWSIA